MKKLENTIKFNPENTAIDTRYSTSANMIATSIEPNKKVLDYGCGTGRNMNHILETCGNMIDIDGTDIQEQLKKEEKKHQILREKGCSIETSDKIQNSSYDVVLNSHVLNVIESDDVKKFVVADIYDKLKIGGKAYIEVRTKKDVEGAKSKEPYNDGWKIKKGNSYTYQEGITKEKMTKLVSQVGFKIEKHIYNSSKHIVIVAK